MRVLGSSASARDGQRDGDRQMNGAMSKMEATMEGNRAHPYSHAVWNLRQARIIDLGVSFAGINEPAAFFRVLRWTLFGPYGTDRMGPPGNGPDGK
jgi:hypothetical protein